MDWVTFLVIVEFVSAITYILLNIQGWLDVPSSPLPVKTDHLDVIQILRQQQVPR